jgi:hypothetical protein
MDAWHARELGHADTGGLIVAAQYARQVEAI